MRFSRTPICSITALIIVAVMPACASDEKGAGGPTDPGSGTPPTSARSEATEDPNVLQGMFDVGGHRLYLRCEGSGSPSVIYLHGLSHTADGGQANGQSAGPLPGLISPKHRFCAYDRANVGQSDDLAGPLTATTSVRDLERLLDAANLKPPYVLLGASFGGLVAEVYAAENPAKVAGLLLLDAGFPDELDLERFFPKPDRLGHGKNHPVSGWADTHELIDELAAYEDAQEAAERTPSIPMTYLLADPPTYDGPGGYVDAYPKELQEFASRYSPGVVKKVSSSHYMETAIPGRIVDELDKLIAGG